MNIIKKIPISKSAGGDYEDKEYGYCEEYFSVRAPAIVYWIYISNEKEYFCFHSRENI